MCNTAIVAVICHLQSVPVKGLFSFLQFVDFCNNEMGYKLNMCIIMIIILKPKRCVCTGYSGVLATIRQGMYFTTVLCFV